MGNGFRKPLLAEDSVYFVATGEVGREVHKVTCNYSTGEPDAYVEVSDLSQGKGSGVPSGIDAYITISPDKQLIAVTASYRNLRWPALVNTSQSNDPKYIGMNALGEGEYPASSVEAPRFLGRSSIAFGAEMDLVWLSDKVVWKFEDSERRVTVPVVEEIRST